MINAIRKFHHLILPLLLGVVVVACSDVSAPRYPEATALPSLSVTGDGGAAEHVLRHSATAPALETYQVSFWAYTAKNRSVEIRYQNGMPNSGSGDRFLRFTVPKGALVWDLDGKRMKPGDSLLVTLSLDPTEFTVDFAPSGLAFDKKTPAELEVWYGNADPDVNRDGVVDAADAAIIESGLGVFHYTKKGDLVWTPVGSSNDASSKTISGVVEGFSGYAVSW